MNKGFVKAVLGGIKKRKDNDKKLPIHNIAGNDSDVCPNGKDCKLIMFTSDFDICQKCNQTFEGK